MVAGEVELGTASVVGHPNGKGIEVVLEKRADVPKGRRLAALRHDHRILDHQGILAVMLDNHGPNIVYRKDVPAERVIAFIERHFELMAKTGGLASDPG